MMRDEGAQDTTAPDILLVEDELMIALDMQSALEKAGIARAHVAGNIESARQMLPQMDRLSAAILDVNLNNGNSFALAEELRARGVPFAFATGYDTGSDLLSNFADVPVLAKPFEETELLSLVRRLLGIGG